MKYITTPIYYVNDAPHVGHAVTTLAADALARFCRLTGQDTFFLTGTDEHGAKINEAAAKAGKEPKEFVDAVSAKFAAAWQDLHIACDGFIRTTDPKHAAYVSKFLQDLYDQGHIYKGEYTGWYCVGCEEFKTETQVGEHATCPIHLTPLKEVSETAYLFKLSAFTDQIQEAIASDTLKIVPESRKNEVLSFIKHEGLRDVAISRKNVAWGIQLPWDKEHTVYVWVDALLNYLSATDPEGPAFASGTRPVWPASNQLIGKDILRFHAIIWPGLLLASGKPLPQKLIVLGFLTLDGHKMSKSLGNILTPQALIERYGVDATRYLLLAAVPFGLDGDISLERFDTLYNSDLANNYGNLVNRVQAMLSRYRDGVVPTVEIEDLGHKALLEIPFGNAIDLITAHVNKLNKYIEDTKPWELAKTNDPKLDTVLATLAENLFIVAVRLWPIMPESSEKILAAFGTSIAQIKYDTLGTSNQTAGKTITALDPLFPRLDR